MRSVGDIIRDLDARDLLHLATQIARKHHVTIEELLGRGRRAPEAAARHELWHRLYEVEIPSLTRIAEIFGRDHSTILAAVHKYKKRDGDPSRILLVETDGAVGASCDGEAAECLESARPPVKKCAAKQASSPLGRSVAS